jgi:hypothetical protein
MGILVVINKPDRRVVHAASEMGVRIHSAEGLAAMSDASFKYYRSGFKGLLSLIDGSYHSEDTPVVKTLDFMRNSIIREKARRKEAHANQERAE